MSPGRPIICRANWINQIRLLHRPQREIRLLVAPIEISSVIDVTPYFSAPFFPFVFIARLRRFLKSSVLLLALVPSSPASLSPACHSDPVAPILLGRPCREPKAVSFSTSRKRFLYTPYRQQTIG